MIGGIVVTYMNNFSAYSAANSHTQTTEFAIVIALTAVSLLTAMLFIGLYLRPKEQYLLRMCRIVKIDANTVVDEDFPISNVDTAKAKAIKLPLPG